MRTILKLHLLTRATALILGFAGFALFGSLEILQERGWDRAGLGLAVLSWVLSFTLWQWSENDFRFNGDSIPAGVKALGIVALIVVALIGNWLLCQWRIGIPIVPNWFIAAVAQSATSLFAVLGIIELNFGVARSGPPSSLRLAFAALGCIGAVLALSIGFDYLAGRADIYDLTAVSVRYPTGRARNPQSGGLLTVVLMMIQLVQMMLVLNVGVVFYVLWRRARSHQRYWWFNQAT